MNVWVDQDGGYFFVFDKPPTREEDCFPFETLIMEDGPDTSEYGAIARRWFMGHARRRGWKVDFGE